MVCCARTGKRDGLRFVRGRGIWAIPRIGLSRCVSKLGAVRAAIAAVEPRGIEPRTSAVQRRRSPG